MSIQPLDGPENGDFVEKLIGQIQSDDFLLYASDYPHWQFEGDDVMPNGIPASLHKKIMRDNPLATYPRLGA
jgi:predicted TIM-barrel fold metal-dependent hydrolase